MAYFIEIESDLSFPRDFLVSMTGMSEAKATRRLLAGVGTKLVSKARKEYKKTGLKKGSGQLYKSIKRTITKDGKYLVVYPSATAGDGKNGVRYGFVLAKGATIWSKALNQGAAASSDHYLHFGAGDKWARAQKVMIKPHDFIQHPAESYLGSQEYKDQINRLLKKEIEKAEKAAERKAAKAVR